MINLKSVKRYCSDYKKIENYEQAVKDTEKWVCHHRLETAFTHSELKRANWYYDRKLDELIFIRETEHNGNTELHVGFRRNAGTMKGKKLSEEHKAKIAAAHIGKKHSAETKAKMSEAHIGKPSWNKDIKASEETKKKMSEAHRNTSAETRRKNGNAARGKSWFNNSKAEVLAFECPEGFVKGRLKK